MICHNEAHFNCHEDAAHTVRACAVDNPAHHTPPQIDEYAYKVVRRKAGASIVGTWKRGTFSSLVLLRSHLHPRCRLHRARAIKNCITYSARNLTTCNIESAAVSLGPFSKNILHQIATTNFATLATDFICIDVLTRKCIPESLRHRGADVRTYIRPINSRQEGRDSKSLSYTAFAALNEPISEGEQKKDGKRPGPATPQKPVPEKPKPQRQGDKGKRKGKSPRTEEAGSYIV